MREVKDVVGVEVVVDHLVVSSVATSGEGVAPLGDHVARMGR